MKRDQPPRSEIRLTTHRKRLLALLQEQALSARELSIAVGLPEKEIYGHLEHLRRSLRHGTKRLLVTAPACRGCGFSFSKRSRLTPPSRCPVCRGESITEALYSIA